MDWIDVFRSLCQRLKAGARDDLALVSTVFDLREVLQAYQVYNQTKYRRVDTWHSN